MSKVSFNKEELERYSRHLILPGFNIEGQRKLKAAKVLVVGSGGLGSPLLLYLAAAGVGTIGIVDNDVVDASNLQRQVLFTTTDLGKPKVEAARDRIIALNPYIKVQVYNTKLTKDNALEIIRNYDVVADGTDNFPTRYLVNDACVLLDKINVYASIYRFEGQASVFNFLREDGTRGPNYRDVFPTPPPPGLVPSCAEGGVLGVLPGILGSLQANEVIKVLAQIGKPLDGRLFLFDASSLETRELKITKNPKNPLNGDHPTQKELIDYNQFCGLDLKIIHSKVEAKSIDIFELKTWIDSKLDFQLIDVREPYEFEIANLGGKLIPQGKIDDLVSEISKDKKVVVLCRIGARSNAVILHLEQKYGFNNLFNLKGGIDAWAKQLDEGMVRY